ncbi:hypothetical protein BJP40_19975 [Streptomyces sp. CC53]|nr:hypothetical protein BJP40_19975 [Streptomyces sp. CC53]
MSLPLPAAAGATRPLVIAVDPSLTSLGIAGTDWAEALRPRDTGHMRLSWLRAEVYDRTRAADLVVIEGPAYRQQHQAGHHEAAGLWWMIVHDLWRRRIPYAVCPPQQRSMYATGRGNAGKGEVRDGVRRLFGVECDGPGRYDQADAVAMAALGAHWLGYPVTTVPASHARALAGVAWPAQTPAVAR